MTEMLIQMQVFWDVTPFRMVSNTDLTTENIVSETWETFQKTIWPKILEGFGLCLKQTIRCIIIDQTQQSLLKKNDTFHNKLSIQKSGNKGCDTRHLNRSLEHFMAPQEILCWYIIF
jgi:hypothetical protein